MDKTLRTLNAYEIPFIIQKAALFGGKIAQPTPHTNLTSTIRSIDIDTYGVMFIKLTEEIEFEEARPITIRLNYRNISFLLDPRQYSVEGDTLVTHLPKEARAIGARDLERYVLPLMSRVQCDIHRIENRGGSIDFAPKIVDVSEDGLGIIVSDPAEDMLRNNDHIWLKTLNTRQLERPIFGKIIYVSRREYKDSVELRAGVSLQTSIPEEIFSELKEMCHLVLKA